MIISDLHYLEDTTQDIDADLQGGLLTFNIGAIFINSEARDSIFVGQNSGFMISSFFTSFFRRRR